MTFETTQGVPARPDAPQRAVLRLNNVGELRLLFAASVMLSHSLLLLDPDGFRIVRTVLNSEAAVQGFFILSGFLVFGSYSRIAEPLRFWRRRFARIYPGYCAAVLVFLALGLIQAGLRGVEIEWSALPRYLLANLSTLNFLQPEVGGVFAGNPISAINGALWSIKVEMMFYAVVPVLFVVGRVAGFVALAVMLIVAGTLYWPLLQVTGELAGTAVPLSFKFQLPGQLHYFGLGVALFALASGAMGKRAFLAVVLLAVALLVIAGQPREALQAGVLVAIIAIGTAMPALPDVQRGRDVSYGIYLAHFPIVQLLLAGGVAALPLPLYVGAVVVLATAYALFSWRFVEKPALALEKLR